MSAFKVVCTEQTRCSQSGHILGVGTYGGTRWSVDEVWSAINSGHTFYTEGGGKTAVVNKYDCPCGRRSLRSSADATVLNNLDYLDLCPA